MIFLRNDDGKFDLDKFMKTMKEHLPQYAMPNFVRVTSTIVIGEVRRVDRIRYADEGYNPAKIKDKLFYWNKTTDKYEELTEAIYADIIVDKILF